MATGFHFRKVCKHGIVVSQCRCIGPKDDVIVECSHPEVEPVVATPTCSCPCHGGRGVMVAMDWQGAPGGSFASETIIGRVDRGASPVTVAAVPASQRLTQQRYWQSDATTANPATTSTAILASAPTLAEMTLDILCSGAPLLIEFSTTFLGNVVGQLCEFGLILDGALDADDARYVQVQTANYNMSVAISRVWVPTPGLRTVKVTFASSNASNTVTAYSTQRRLTVVELAT